MQRVTFVLLLVLVMAQSAVAGPFSWLRRSTNVVRRPVSRVVSGGFATAQAVANHMARIGRVGHFGGNKGYEGCGSGSSPRAAEWNCCYRHQMTPKEVGVAKGANGMWYACCRY